MTAARTAGSAVVCKIVGDVANEHADFRPLFREPKNTTTLERALYVAEDSSKFKLLWGERCVTSKTTATEETSEYVVENRS